MAETVGFDEAISMLSANQGDTQILFRVVGEELASSLSAFSQRTYAGRFGKKAKELTAISIELGDRVFGLSLGHGRLSAVIARNSGGIRISSDKVQVDAWLVELREELAVQAGHSDAARLALEKLVLEG